ncbi:Uncharacterized conserved protein YukE [Amycolatopsis marina]|uniref:Uncharacterized conserved protein YukE n=1 Tax=Amycolatopsis marina TaxID=490629 RepID=A0A1I1ARG3_9PSEU|nr:hypothetical protein [Amycolatopsis marina]SFB40604.1 Uncharacterized conserved protein YukE [Amycolatopsis marina]
MVEQIRYASGATDMLSQAQAQCSAEQRRIIDDLGVRMKKICGSEWEGAAEKAYLVAQKRCNTEIEAGAIAEQRSSVVTQQCGEDMIAADVRCSSLFV